VKMWKWGWGSERFDGVGCWVPVELGRHGFLYSWGGMGSLSWGGVNA